MRKRRHIENIFRFFCISTNGIIIIVYLEEQFLEYKGKPSLHEEMKVVGEYCAVPERSYGPIGGIPCKNVGVGEFLTYMN